MTHSIQCSCGNLKGALRQPKGVNRCVCYCADCQAFAHFLKRPEEILDESGGTEIIQTTPKEITLNEGIENLACMRLTENGLLRWYAACCNTPIANTPANFKTPFVGLVHNCLKQQRYSLNEVFGPILMRAHTKHAKGQPKPKTMGLAAGISRVIGMILKARLTGSYKHTPFFAAQTDTPIVRPKVLTSEELRNVTNAL